MHLAAAWVRSDRDASVRVATKRENASAPRGFHPQVRPFADSPSSFPDYGQ